MSEPIDILLIEDNPGDALLIRESMRDLKLGNRLHHVDDGDKALRFLRREGEHGDAPRPGLVLLDLNLPGMSGREILAEIKKDADLGTIPVVVMTSSAAERDIVESYELHANCYVTKPLDLDQFMHVVRSIECFWLSVVKLPSA